MKPEDAAFLAETLRRGSRSFAWAAALLPAEARRDAQILYALCREADDAIDEAACPQKAFEKLTARVDRLWRQASTGLAQPQGVTDRAVCDLLRRHPKLIHPIRALLAGFAWDAQHRQYPDIAATLAYCARVAASVGVAMALVLGQSAPWVLARAADLGTAMQLTNIARDVGEDARRGRIYLPTEWLEEAGLSREHLLSGPQISPALATQVARLLHLARPLYRRSLLGVCALPARVRPAIVAAAFIYEDIGRSIAKNGYDTLSRRAFVSGSRKAYLLAHAVLKPQQWHHAGASAEDLQARFAPPLAANAFLIEGCHG